MIDLDRIVLEVAHRVATRYRHRDEQGVTTYGFTEPHMKDFAHALLARLEQEGWKLIPKEPTQDMLTNGSMVGSYCKDTYKAMLAAAPKVMK